MRAEGGMQQVVGRRSGGTSVDEWKAGWTGRRLGFADEVGGVGRWLVGWVGRCVGEKSVVVV